MLLLTQAAGLLATLSDPTLAATVFAPTNAAFALALASSGLTPAQLLANTTILAEVRLYALISLNHITCKF